MDHIKKLETKRALTATAAAVGLTVASTLFKVYRQLNPVKVNSFGGKTVLITGAAGGVGRCICLDLARKPALERPRLVILWDINENGMQETVKQMKEVCADLKTRVQKINLCDRMEIYAKSKELIDLLGDSPDVIINNAGFLAVAKLLDLEDEKAITEYEVNQMAHLWMAKAFLPQMISSNKNKFHFVNVASQASFISVPGVSTYAASKFALRGLWIGIASEIRLMRLQNKIKISMLFPTLMETPMAAGLVYPGLTFASPEGFAKECTTAMETEEEIITYPRNLRWTIIILAAIQAFGSHSGALPPEDGISNWDPSNTNKVFAQIKNHSCVDSDADKTS